LVGVSVTIGFKEETWFFDIKAGRSIIRDFCFEAKAYHIQYIFAQTFYYALKSLLLSIGYVITFKCIRSG
jgi:hypothetical protein